MVDWDENNADRIRIILETRRKASEALLDAFKATIDTPSENKIRDSWLAHISAHSDLSSQGWYLPPPGGACILVGQPETNFSRLNYNSLRDRETWSRDDIFVTERSVIYAYASPIAKGTGLIGDTGISLYSGDDPVIIDHLQKCLKTTVDISNYAEVGMPLRELLAYARQRLSEAELSNQATSRASGVENIGHTIPWSYEDYSAQEGQILRGEDHDDILKTISEKRISINDSAELRIQPNMAFTVEPQIRSERNPLCSYHLIVAFYEGRKKATTYFDSIFEYFGMNEYMRPILETLVSD